MAEAIGAACVILAVLVAVVAVLSISRQRHHRDQFREWAARNGWTYTPRPDVDCSRHLPGGNRHGVDHAFTATRDGRPVTVAAYSVTDASDGTTANTHHYVITVAGLTTALPTTEVEHRSRTSRLATKIFGPGETATGHADFDRTFRIRTTDPPALNQWFSPALVAAHLTGRIPTRWTVQGTELLCQQTGRLETHDIPHHATAALTLAALLDGHT